MDIDFHSKYIKVDFDKLVDNPLVNSDEFYLNFKKKYFKTTEDLYNKLNKLNTKLEYLEKSGGYTHNSNNTKHTFVYIDDKQIEETKQLIKDIYIKQDKAFLNFYEYVLLLNKNPNIFIDTKKQKKSLLSKLFS